MPYRGFLPTFPGKYTKYANNTESALGLKERYLRGFSYTMVIF